MRHFAFQLVVDVTVIVIRIGDRLAVLFRRHVAIDFENVAVRVNTKWPTRLILNGIVNFLHDEHDFAEVLAAFEIALCGAGFG